MLKPLGKLFTYISLYSMCSLKVYEKLIFPVPSAKKDKKFLTKRLI
jgi:hypothetical protein